MQQNPPPELPAKTAPAPAGPVEMPEPLTRRLTPGRRAPLPDPMALQQLKVPDFAPPYDGEQVGDRDDCAARSDVTSGSSSDQTRDANGSRAYDAGEGPGAGPGPGRWPSHFAQVLAETLAGSRPAQQLRPWTTEQTRQRIRQLGPLLATDQRPRVRRIMSSAPCQEVLELTAVVGFGPRVRVLALRLERADRDSEHWCCTAIDSA